MYTILRNGKTVDKVDNLPDAYVSLDAWEEFYPDSKFAMKREKR